jgi:hypothetical protein
MRARVDFWRTRPAGIETSAAWTIASNTGYPTEPEHLELLSESASPMAFDPASWNETVCAGSFTLTARAACQADGLCGFFQAELAPGIWMTNDPRSADSIYRRPAFLPFDRPLPLAAGEALSVRVRVLPADSIVSWDVSRADGSDRMSHSTWRGLLPTREEIQRTRPDAVPSLTIHGAARRTVLELCDQRRTIREIEDAVFERHRELFPQRRAAEVLVAEVLGVYART